MMYFLKQAKSNRAGKPNQHRVSFLSLVLLGAATLLIACGEQPPTNLAAVVTPTSVPTTVAPSPTPTIALPSPTPDVLAGLGLKEFSPPNGNFKMMLPGQPQTEASSLISNHEGRTNVQTYLANYRKDAVLIWVGYQDYSEEYLKQNGPEKILASQRESLVKTQGITLKNEKDLKLEQTYPGKEFQYGAQAWGLIVQRYYLVNTRLYTLAAVGLYGITPTYTFTIFDTFKLTT